MSSAEVDRHRAYGIRAVVSEGSEEAEGPDEREGSAVSVPASEEEPEGPETKPMPLVRDNGGISRS